VFASYKNKDTCDINLDHIVCGAYVPSQKTGSCCGGFKHRN